MVYLSVISGAHVIFVLLNSTEGKTEEKSKCTECSSSPTENLMEVRIMRKNEASLVHHPHFEKISECFDILQFITFPFVSISIIK